MKAKNNEILIKKIILVGTNVNNSKNSSKNKEENNNKIDSSGDVKNLRKDREHDKSDIDNDISVTSSISYSGRSRKSLSKSNPYEVKTSKEKIKTKKIKSKKSSKSDPIIVENIILDGDSEEDKIEHIKLEEKKIKSSGTLVVEIENKNNLVKQESIISISDSSDSSLQEIDTSVNSTQTISSIEKDDHIKNIRKSNQSIDNGEIKTRKINLRIKNIPIIIDNKLNPKPNETILDKINNKKKDNNSRNASPNPHNNSSNHGLNNKTSTSSSNNYYSRSHSKRKKKSTSKKLEISSSGRSIYVPAGLINPNREKSHHQKVDEGIKEDMDILRKCIPYKSGVNAKPSIEKLEKG